MNFHRVIVLSILFALPAAAETQVRIRGLTSKSEEQLLSLMGGRLEHVRNGEATAARADDAAFLVRQLMLKDGYADVRVDGKALSGIEILLTVQEGKRLSLGNVTVDGVDAEMAGKLVKLYSLPAEKNNGLELMGAPFREEDSATGISYIEQELNANAYWAASAEITMRSIDPDTGKVSVAVQVKTGERFTISTPRISSSDNRGYEEIQKTAQPYVGRRATTKNLNAMRGAVDEVFGAQGYPDAKITMARTLGQGVFIPEFYIALGKRVRLHSVHPEGLVITDPERIKERLKVLEGDWYNEAAMNKRIRELLATGAFTTVRLETHPISDSDIDATLHIEEGKAKQLSFAAGADTYQGPIFRTTYADRNLWGQLLGFSSGLEFSARGVLGEVKLTDPWLFGNDIAGSVRAYALSYAREGYDSLETGVDASVQWKVNEHYTMELLAGASIVNLSESGLPISELGETVYTHPKLTFTQSLDYRDSKVLPTTGWHFEAPLEIGAAVGTVSTAYASAEMSGAWYHQINSNLQIVLAAQGGVLLPSGTGNGLPIDMRFFTGGSSSVRSFPERELGPLANGYATGGEASWHANAEMIRTITGSVKGVLFLDAGSLSRSYDEITSAKLNLATGLGIRLDLPIGPVRLEYGYNLTQETGEPIGALHFSIGTAF